MTNGRSNGMSHDYYVVAKNSGVLPRIRKNLGRYFSKKEGVNIALIGDETNPLGLAIYSLVCDPDSFFRLVHEGVSIDHVQIFDTASDEQLRVPLQAAYSLIGQLQQEATLSRTKPEEVTELTSRLHRTSSELIAKAASLKDLEKKYDSLERDYHVLRQENQELGTAKAHLREEKETLEQRINAAKQELKENKTALTATAQGYTLTLIQLVIYEARIKQLTNIDVEQEERIDKLIQIDQRFKETVIDLGSKLETKTAELETITTELTTATAELQELRARRNTTGMDAESLLVEAFKKMYSGEYAQTTAKYQEIFPRGISVEMGIAVTPLKEYVLEEIGIPLLTSLGIEVKESELEDIKLKLEEKTRDYRTFFPEFDQEYKMALAYITSQAGLSLQRRREDFTHQRAVHIKEDYEKEEALWRNNSPLARKILSQWDALITTHEQAQAVRPPISELEVGCYAYVRGKESPSRISFLLPIPHDQLTTGLGYAMIAGLCSALQHHGKIVRAVPVGEMVRYDVMYPGWTPGPDKIKETISLVEKEFQKTVSGHLGLRLKLSYFGEVD